MKTTEDLLLSKPKEVCILAHASVNGSGRRVSLTKESPVAEFRPARIEQKTHQAMTKSLDVISEAIHNRKHSFGKVDSQPNKPLKHRYERRKVRSYLHLGDWVSGEAR